MSVMKKWHNYLYTGERTVLLNQYLISYLLWHEWFEFTTILYFSIYVFTCTL